MPRLSDQDIGVGIGVLNGDRFLDQGQDDRQGAYTPDEHRDDQDCFGHGAQFRSNSNAEADS